MGKGRLFYVEDDESLSFVTRDNLQLEGYEVAWYSDGASAQKAFSKGQFDLCILDVMLPELDGFSLAKAIREIDSEIPILFLTAKSLQEDRLEGLRLGADDYLTKPFDLEELVLKIEVFLKRRKLSVDLSGDVPTQLGNYVFDFSNLKLSIGEDDRNLTRREADLLFFLSQNPNRVLERSAILIQVWGSDDYFLGRSLDVFISRLRKYLKEDPSVQIETLHGIGFRLLTEPSLMD